MKRRVFSFDELDGKRRKNVMEAYSGLNLGEIQAFVVDDTALVH
jgi:hypothetical protein